MNNSWDFITKSNSVAKMNFNHTNMIKTRVYVGNSNYYDIDLYRSSYLGLLPLMLTRPINKEPSDVLFMICNGCLLGAHASTKPNQQVCDLPIVDDECTIFLVLKPSGAINMFDRAIEQRYTDWITYNTTFRPYQQVASTLLNRMGFTDIVRENVTDSYETLLQFPDIDVTVPRNELVAVLEEVSCPVSDCFCGNPEPDLQATMTNIRLCGHKFHRECITRWLTERAVTCPVCGRDVRIPSEH